jgi:hypothetical protein
MQSPAAVPPRQGTQPAPQKDDSPSCSSQQGNCEQSIQQTARIPRRRQPRLQSGQLHLKPFADATAGFFGRGFDRLDGFNLGALVEIDDAPIPENAQTVQTGGPTTIHFPGLQGGQRRRISPGDRSARSRINPQPTFRVKIIQLSPGMGI